MKIIKIITVILLVSSFDLSFAYGQIMSTSRDYTCTPSQEICGDMVDQNCDGEDPPCDGDDRDRDGYTSKVDCDDKDPFIYPGRHTSCKALCQQGTKLCQADGTYSFCTCKPLCEAKGDGNCYYIEPKIGFDINDGSFLKPWESFSNINHQDGDISKLKYWKGLKAGDVLYLLSGLHSGAQIQEKEGVGIELNGVRGTKENPITIKTYPNNHADLNPAGKYPAISITNSSYINIENLKIQDASGSAIYIKDSDNINISDSIIKETERNKGPHTYGIHIDNSVNILISNSKIFENFDTKAKESGGLTSEYSSNILVENSEKVKLYKNVIFHYRPTNYNKTGGCLTAKRGLKTKEGKQGVIVENNIFWNCKFNAIAFDNMPGQIINNLILESEPILVKNISSQYVVRINNNTIIGSNGIIMSNFSDSVEGGKILFAKNAVVDDEDQSGARPMISLVNTGKSFIDKKAKNNNVLIDYNCYFTPKELSLTFTSSIIRGLTNSQKKEFDFYLWKEFGYDKHSKFVEPHFDDNFDLLSLECEDYGWKNVSR